MRIFNFIKRKKEEKEQRKLQRAAEARAAYQARKKLITDFLKSEYDRRDAERKADYLKTKARADKSNGTCPKCGSTKVVNSIKRAKGEMHGSGSSYSSSFLFSHHSSNNFSVDGKLDTYPVNKCSECGNEWNVTETLYPTDWNPYSAYSSLAPMRMCDNTVKYLNIKWDPNDRTEEFGSLEEKKEDFLSKSQSSYWLEDYKKAPREALEYAAYNYMEYNSYDDDVMKVFKPKDDDDEYTYTFPDGVWEIVKKVVGWTGSETE